MAYTGKCVECGSEQGATNAPCWCRYCQPCHEHGCEADDIHFGLVVALVLDVVENAEVDVTASNVILRITHESWAALWEFATGAQLRRAFAMAMNLRKTE